MNGIKKVAAINDLSGFCRCSLTAAIPIISAMGLHCCPFPTAVLSNHTGYDSFFFDDYTDKMESYLEQWKKHNLKFDAVYTGFLGSVKQIDTVIDFIKYFKNENNIVLVDPVMGDGGKIYSTYSASLCREMKKLVSLADVITPNVTECCLLSDTEYIGEEISLCDVKKMCEKIEGAKIIVVTGIRNNDNIINYIYNSVSKEENSTVTANTGEYYDGTGDVFASVLCGYLTYKKDILDAVKNAADFVEKSVRISSQCGISHKEGIAFEKCIADLIQK